ncbi:MAG TPA: RDD family protein [Mycobacteriales bacterium]|nr:RDD family protein [Mycobacteriales bacterium]
MTSPPRGDPTAPIPGATAGIGRRLGAFALDAVASDLIALLFGQVAWWNALVLFVEYVVLLGVGGQTLGMFASRIRVVPVAGGRLDLRWVLVRTVLLFLLVPAVIIDKSGRGLHDRASGTAVVRV